MPHHGQLEPVESEQIGNFHAFASIDSTLRTHIFHTIKFKKKKKIGKFQGAEPFNFLKIILIE